LRIAPKSVGFTVLLGVLAALPALSIDIAAPTLALIPEALGTSSTVASLTLSLFVVGFACGQLGGGRLSDLRGRRPVLLAALACYTLAGLGCTAAASGLMLLLARLAQGLGAGACFVLSFATVQDLFEGEAARTKRSYVTVVFGIIPMLAPAVGAFLSGSAGWRAVYAVLAVGGGCLLAIVALGMEESRRAAPAPPIVAALARPRRIRDDRTFVRVTLANALSYAAIFTYIAGAPIIIIGQMHYSSAVFAAVFASTAAALAAGAWTNGRLSVRGVQVAATLAPALVVSAAAAIALAAACVGGQISGTVLVPLLLVTMFCRGVIAPNMQHLAIERWPDQAGAASATVGVSQLLAAAIASAVVGVLMPDYGAAGVAVPMALLATAALFVWRRISR
jgi:DHA1 family bicyclomycin/chloramphenicol resistance-like MFS transporter